MIPCTFNPGDFISAINIATAYSGDVDQWSDERKATILNLSSPDDPIVTNIWKRGKPLALFQMSDTRSLHPIR
jgi:hypothetical protein